MAGLRKGKCYKRVKRAYTRKSKYKKKAFIKTAPTNKIIKFDLGDLRKEFSYRVDLISKEPMQIRHNALESSRVLLNRHLIENLGGNFKLKIRIYPHHILRENKMLTGAGADRMQSGMQRAFGKPVGLSAQVRKGKTIFSAYVDKKDIDTASKILKKATPRIPCRCGVDVVRVG